jgi:hypothetical protein
MLALVFLGIALFMIGYQKIKEFSASTRTTAAQAQASDSSVQNLVKVKKQLEADADVIQRASLIVSESKSYVYQDQIIQDINRFAGNAGITVTNISFSDVGTAGTVASAAPAAAPAAAAGATGATAPTGTATPAGVKTTTATVTVKNPVDYNKMLLFIHSIEDSLFKMRISQVTLSKPTDANSPNDVTSDVFTIEVYLR